MLHPSGRLSPMASRPTSTPASASVCQQAPLPRGTEDPLSPLKYSTQDPEKKELAHVKLYQALSVWLRNQNRSPEKIFIQVSKEK